MRCPECGHNNPPAIMVCEVCREALSSAQTARTDLRPVSHRVPASRPPAQEMTRGGGYSMRETFSSSPTRGTREEQPQTGRNHADVTGRVISADAPYLEHPDFDLCRVLTKTLWLVLLVISPLIALHAILTALGGFSAIIALLGLLFFARYLSPSNLFSVFHLMQMANPLGPNRASEQVPVRYLRVRGMDGDGEYVVRIKGSFTLGNLMADDLVSFWGRWRGGVLHATHAFSHRTQTWVELQRSYSWLTLVLTVCVIILLLGYFYEPVAHLWARIQEMEVPQ